MSVYTGGVIWNGVSFPFEICLSKNQNKEINVGAGLQRKMVSSCSIVRGNYPSHSLGKNLIPIKVNSEALV